ncbi:OsmC family protein [Kaistia dalseonensis]|uniref:OsmC-like protein n=1 Tax=Kaistia dalseonensis TaxID=410840 RepID=A0ABU0HA45_9HYPH|nr:OsmC family protein [Kaistia dalseonensis]MCX5496036.1 OsmC family protein [Kaistia dalseonensis]MDQ0438640.1 putative OsmC-like protein [Kaistia dalseonensis]
MVNVKVRPTGASAVIGRHGPASVTSATGGTVALNSGSSDPAFSPIDLLYAAVAGCLVVSARMAAHEMGVLDRIESVNAAVRGEKAADAPSRVDKLDITLDIVGELDEATKTALIARAEELCTVSNTLKNTPAFVTNGH